LRKIAQDSFLEDKSYWEIVAQVQALGVPIYPYPTAPSPDTLRADEKRPELVGPLWSFTIDTATQALRLIFSGTFDRYPNLTVILGHLGETLPISLSCERCCLLLLRERTRNTTAGTITGLAAQ
jgi:predicted TIM-barrel fold metal-dependent hydrolase